MPVLASEALLRGNKKYSINKILYWVRIETKAFN